MVHGVRESLVLAAILTVSRGRQFRNVQGLVVHRDSEAIDTESGPIVFGRESDESGRHVRTTDEGRRDSVSQFSTPSVETPPSSRGPKPLRCSPTVGGRYSCCSGHSNDAGIDLEERDDSNEARPAVWRNAKPLRCPAAANRIQNQAGAAVERTAAIS